MSPDETPVADDEPLMRVIASAEDRFDFGGRQPRAGLYMPAANDADGISLFRSHGSGHAASFLTPEALVEAQPNPDVKSYGGVAALSAGETRGATSAHVGFTALTVEPAPAELPGHVLIPQINRAVSQDKTTGGRDLIRDLAAKLARLARVVIAPTPKPLKS